MALAHTIGNKADAAYRRIGVAMRWIRRRAMLEAWAAPAPT